VASTALEAVVRDPAAPDVLQVLVENHRRFLSFLERRLGSREVAEDLLQEGFARAIERGPTLRDGDSVVAWFYRLLRNAVTDHYRRRGAEDRALAWVAGTTDQFEPGPDPDLHATVCGCVGGLVRTLKPEYAKALQRVELDGVSVARYAQETGITSNNAGVRLHRAREALRRQVILSCGTCCAHGCLDCACGEPRRP
jgi:RNA polymerase sigma-70 factor (ECF subfamily)